MTTVPRRHGWHHRAYAALAIAALWPALAMAQNEQWSPLAHAPDDIERLLLGLKTAESGLPLAARRGMLQRAEAIEVPRADGTPDRYLRLKHEADGLYFSATVRTLAGARPQDTVYLLQTGSEIDGCIGLKALLSPGERVGRKFCVFDEEQGAARIHAGAGTRFGFTAYRLDGRGRAHDVTRRVLPDDPLLRAPDRASYAVHDETGAHPGVSVDMSRLSEVPVLRLYVELGDGGGLPRTHPRAFPGGYPGAAHTAHFGFLVWNGQRFDLRNTVPRAQWPCTNDASFSPSGQSCLDSDPDPFIVPTTPAP